MSSKTKESEGVLRCLSIQQPMAWLVCANAKKVENRTWKTNFRGTIAIHASTKKTRVGELVKYSESGVPKKDMFAFAAVIGLADIEAIEVYGPEFESDGHACGPYCWKMTNGRFLKTPVPMLGKLSLFSLSQEITEKVLASETYQVDLTPGTDAAIIAKEALPEPMPIDAYEYTVSELDGKIDNQALMTLCNRMIEIEPEVIDYYFRRIILRNAIGEENGNAEDALRALDLIHELYGTGEDDAELKKESEDWAAEEQADSGLSDQTSDSEEEGESEDDHDETSAIGSDKEAEDEKYELTPVEFYDDMITHIRHCMAFLRDSSCFDESLKLNARLLALEPTNAEFLFDRSLILFEADNNLSEAAADMERTITLIDAEGKSDDKDRKWFRRFVYRFLARTYLKTRQIDRAKVIIDSVLADNVPETPTLIVAAMVAEALGDMPTAKEYAKRASTAEDLVPWHQEVLDRIL